MLHKIDNPLESCELKFGGAEGRFSGYASVFGSNDAFNDTILKGAFSETLEKGRMPMMFYGHNPGRVIGKWLSMKEDDKGLLATGELTPGHTDAQNVYASMKHGAISGLSIGFRIPEGGAEEKEGGGRIISKIDLKETSVVSMPAEDSARIISVKQEISEITSLKDAEYFLRDSGMFSRSEATAFISHIKTVIQSDSEAELIETRKALASQAEREKGKEWLASLIERI